MFSYSKTLKEAFKLSFKNYLVFVPLALSWLLGLALIPFTWNLNFENGFSVRIFILLFFFSLVSGIVSLVIYGWMYALIRNIVKKRKLNLSEGFFQGLPLAWKRFKVQLLLVFLFMATFLVGGLLALLYFIPVIGKGILVILILCAVILLLAAGFALGYMSPILILENYGAGESIRQNYRFFMKHTGHSIAMGLVSILLVLLAVLPLFIFQFQKIFASLGGQVLQPSLASSLQTQILSLPVLLLEVVIILFYCLAYLQLKKK